MDCNIKNEFLSYQKLFTGITGKSIKVVPIPAKEDSIGYTSNDGTIHLTEFHPIMSGLKPEKFPVFRKGVFVHEMLHQIFTDFDYSTRMLRSVKNDIEKRILALVSNVLEDPAIEYWAPTVMGGTALKALKFSIFYIYQQSPVLEESKSAFSQYINALIQMGDMGILKGRFTFDSAKDAFSKTAALFNEGICEADGKKRIDIAAKIVEITRSFWEKEFDDQMKLLEFLEELEKQGKSGFSGKGSGQPGDSELLPKEDKKSKARKITIKKVSKEEYEEIKKNASDSDGDMDGDITVIVCDEAEKENDEKSNSGSASIPQGDASQENSDEHASCEQNGSGSSQPSANEKNETAKESGASKNDDFSKKGNSSETGDRSKEEEVSSGICDETEDDVSDAEKIKEEIEKECEITTDDIERISEEIKRAEIEEEKEMLENKENTSKLEDFDIDSHICGHQSCANLRVTIPESAHSSADGVYSEIVNKNSAGIKTLSNSFKKMFLRETEEKEHHTTGRINLLRANNGRASSRIFDKRRTPSNKSNTAIMILVDESGSMYGGCGVPKYVAARDCCISLAEVFAELNLPLYVMGFTADTCADVVHNHYVEWKNTKNERRKLINISAIAENADGYSIRYATQLLKKRKEAHKLLIVLSDGQPSAPCYYRHRGDGVADTKQAIKDAKKSFDVLGVAIGNSDTETIHYMYESDFLHINNVQEMFASLSRKVADIIKKW